MRDGPAILQTAGSISSSLEDQCLCRGPSLLIESLEVGALTDDDLLLAKEGLLNACLLLWLTFLYSALVPDTAQHVQAFMIAQLQNCHFIICSSMVAPHVNPICFQTKQSA